MADIKDMKLLLALDQHRHFSNAAHEIGISQPAFSARLRKIEQELGLPIVRRGNKFLGFTRDGDILLKWARKIMADMQGMHQELDVSKGGLRGTLVVGAVPTALPFAATVSAQMRKKHPNLTVEIQSLPSTQIAIRLNDFSLDAGITYIEDGEIVTGVLQPLYEETYVLIAPKDLAPRLTGKATWGEAAKLPLCLLTRDMRNRAFIDAAFESVGENPVPVMETNGFTAALALVSSGSAATVAPKGLADSLYAGSDSVRLLLEKPTLKHAIGLAIQEHDPPLPALEALKEAIKASL